MTLVIISDTHILNKARQTVMGRMFCTSCLRLALLTDEGHSLTVTFDVISMFCSSLVRGAVRTLKDTLSRLEKAVLFVSDMLIVKIDFFTV